MKKRSAIFILTIVIVIACKKSSNTTSTSSSSSGSTNPSGPYYGFLIGTRAFDFSGGILYPNANTGTAYFFSTPSNISTMIPVGGVWVGNNKFKYDAVVKEYYDTTYSLGLNPTTWQITGASVIPTFTFTNNDSLATYTGYAALPDTIYKNQNLNLQINGVSGADLIEVLIMDGYSSSPPHMFTKYTTTISANNTISIPSSSLSGMTSSTSFSGSMAIYLQKYNNQTISGKAFRFISQKQVGKNVWIK